MAGKAKHNLTSKCRVLHQEFPPALLFSLVVGMVVGFGVAVVLGKLDVGAAVGAGVASACSLGLGESA